MPFPTRSVIRTAKNELMSPDALRNLIAKMHGMVRGIGVVLGQSVKLGDRLLSLEAMKMEHSMNAPCNGTVKAIHVQEALQVTPGKLLIEIEPDGVV